MPEHDESQWGTSTRGVRSAEHRGFEGEHSMAIYATSSYAFDSAEDAESRFNGTKKGNVYSRFSNPSVDAFAKRLAALEGGECGVATASGMSAILSTCMGLLQAGDHVVTTTSLFGSTIGLFNNYLSKFGIRFSFVALDDLDAWRDAITPNTKMLFVESPTNPLTEIADLAALGEIAHAHDCLLVVDNCFCTPALQRPLEFGADIVVHSATKFIDGQGRCLGGAVIGNAELVGDKVFHFLRSAGTTMSPFNAWLFYKSLETLEVRMQAHCQRALALAEWLEGHAGVNRVIYPGLPSHPHHDLAKRQQPGGFGGIMAIEVAGGKQGAFKLIDNTRMLTITNNLGDTRTTIVHPATTTHFRIGPDGRAKAGVTDGMVRISVGLENVEDIMADLEPGLAG